MKRFQSVLCALALACSLSSTVFAGDIHGSSFKGDIHGIKGDIHGITGNAGILTWADITGVIVSILGDIHG